MKKITFLAVAVAFLGMCSFTNHVNPEVNKVVYSQGGSVKIINDTDNDIRIHTGSGVVSLNANGGSTSISCNPGTKIYTAPNGTKKDFIFEIEDSMCDKTVKLSKYL